MITKSPKISVFKDLFKSQDVPFIVPLEKIIQRIKVGKSKELIKQIRKGNKELKKKLPCIVFAGEFTERKSKGLKNHSGLMVLDFDGYPNEKELKTHLKLLKQNKHFIVLFISPSGNGLKGVIRVPNDLNEDTHPKYFKAFQEAFKYDYFDISNSNVDRVCFESYDPNIYVNYNAEVFKPEIKDDGFLYVNRPPKLPITNEEVIINKIMSWNWSKDFTEGQRNSFIFDLAGAFCEYGVSKLRAEGYILSNIVNGNFREKEALNAISSAYVARNHASKYFEDYNTLKRIKHELPKGKSFIKKTYQIDEDTYNKIKEAKELEDFWFFNKDNRVQIKSLEFKYFLESNGFKKYFPNDAQKPTWVRVRENKVKETSVEKIKDFVLNYLLEQKEFKVWEKCVNSINMFSENKLGMLESIELMMLKDTRSGSFIAFKNGILKVTKNEIELIDYIDVNGYVWESHIINRDYNHKDNDDNDYKTFIRNISHDNSLPIETVIGYLLSTYKNKMSNKAIILNDELISDNAEGGTGKGLFIQGIKQIRRVSILDGKAHDDKKSFPYQTVKQDTQILVFDDVKKNFDFEQKFSLVTEGMTLERKNKDAIKLTVEESPKLVITTNYAIKGEGNSHERRRHEIEIAQYYNRKITPFYEFGRELFSEWNEDDFSAFDNYMVYCLQVYLKNGLIQQNAKNLKLRKFIAETAYEFYEWISDNENFPLNSRNFKADKFEQLINEYPDLKKWLTRKRFNNWVRKYANFIDADFEQGNTNGLRWFKIYNGEESENIDDIEF